MARSTGRLRVRHQRGQSLVEFAMVAPVLFAILFGFIVMSAWWFNKTLLEQAAENGVRAANESIGAASVIMASDARLTTPYVPNRNEWFFDTIGGGAACLEARNRFVPSPTDSDININVDNLGWDWGCVYGAGTYAGPLDDAINAARDSIRVLYMGSSAGIDIRACYIVVPIDAAGREGSPECAFGRHGNLTGGISGYGSVPANFRLASDPPNGGAGTNTPAPRYIRVEIDVNAGQIVRLPLLDRFGISPSIVLHARAQEVLDRFLPSCPAPATVSETRPGTCGGIY